MLVVAHPVTYMIVFGVEQSPKSHVIFGLTFSQSSQFTHFQGEKNVVFFKFPLCTRNLEIETKKYCPEYMIMFS